MERAHRDGILTAASLMVGAPAAADAVARAKRLPALRIGLHLVLVEAKPVLPAAAIPDLVDAAGAFRTDMARVGAAMFFLPSVRRQLAAEIEAQFAAFAGTGIALDHANAHKHFHLHPTIGSLMVRIGRRYGLRAVRVPVEPLALLRRIEPVAGGGGTSLLALWAKRLKRQMHRAGMQVPDRVLGLAWSGALHEARLAGLLRHLPEGLTEIYLHPATGRYPGDAPGYRYQDELAALLSPLARAALPADARRGGFADLVAA